MHLYIFGGLVGLVGGNFAFQYFSSAPDWAQAMERSYFQMAGVAATWLVVAICLAMEKA